MCLIELSMLFFKFIANVANLATLIDLENDFAKKRNNLNMKVNHKPVGQVYICNKCIFEPTLGPFHI